MDRLGFPYKTGKQCDSCPNSCEPATNREYKKKLRYKTKRSVTNSSGMEENDEKQDKKLVSDKVRKGPILKRATSQKIMLN